LFSIIRFSKFIPKSIFEVLCSQIAEATSFEAVSPFVIVNPLIKIEDSWPGW